MARKSSDKPITLAVAKALVVATVTATDRHGQAAALWQTIQDNIGARKTPLETAEVDMIKDQADAILNQRHSNPGTIKSLKTRIVKLNEFAPVILNVLSGETRDQVKATTASAEKFGSLMRKHENNVKAAVAAFTEHAAPNIPASQAMRLAGAINVAAGKHKCQSAGFRAAVVYLADCAGLRIKGADDCRDMDAAKKFLGVK